MFNWPIFVIALTIGTVLGDPTTKITVNKVAIQVKPNPYFGEWTPTLGAAKDSLSLKLPITKDVPLEMMLNMNIKMGDDDLGGTEMTLCEGFKNEFLGRDLAAAGTPKGKFPTDCPIKAGTDFAISNYVFPNEKVPPGIPDGPISGDISLYEVGKDPYVVITFEGELAHKVPGFGR